MPLECPAEIVVFDLETTGLSPEHDGIVEVGAVKIIGGVIQTQGHFETLVKPTNAAGQVISIPQRAKAIHGISDAMVSNAPTIAEVLPDFLRFVGQATVVAHNARFDCGFIQVAAQRQGLAWRPQSCCTVQLSRRAFPRERAHNLTALAERLGLHFAEGGRHRSFGDVEVTAQAYLKLMAMLQR